MSSNQKPFMNKNETSNADCLRRLVGQHVKLLNEILRHQIANLGSKDEFYCCYTYAHGKMPKWVKKAKRLVLPNAEVSDGASLTNRKTNAASSRHSLH